MKGLTMGEWSLIARYLKDEASQNDLDQLHGLVDRHPNLQGELEMLGFGINNSEPSGTGDTGTFDTDRAFGRLNDRFLNENLI